MSAYTSVAGPLGHAIAPAVATSLRESLRRMERAGVAFAARPDASPRRWRKISADQLSDALLKQAPRLDDSWSVVTTGGRSVLRTLEDLRRLDGRYADSSAATAVEKGCADALQSLQDLGWKLTDAEDPKHKRVINADEAFENLTVRNRTTLIQGPKEPWGRAIDSLQLPAALDFTVGSGINRGLPDRTDLVRDLDRRGYRLRDADGEETDDYLSAARAICTQNLLVERASDGACVPLDAALAADPTKLEARLDQSRTLRDTWLAPWLASSNLGYREGAGINRAMALIEQPPAKWDADAWRRAFSATLMAANGSSTQWNRSGARQQVRAALENVERLETIATTREEFDVLSRAAARTSGSYECSKFMEELGKGELDDFVNHDLALRALGPEDQTRLKAEFLELVAAAGTIDEARKVYDMVSIPVAGTSFADRTALYGELHQRIPQYDAAVLGNRMRAFHVVLSHHLPSESLQQTSSRFFTLLDDSHTDKTQRDMTESVTKAANVFVRIQEGTRHGAFGDATADDALLTLREALLFEKDPAHILDDAAARLSRARNPATIERHANTVVVGGLVLPVRVESGD